MPSFNNTIDDSGTPAGFPVANVSTEGFWIITGTSLNMTYTVCLSYEGTLGIVDESELAVLKRKNGSEPWRPQMSVLDQAAQQVCASGLNTLSEFALGGSSANPLPVELAGLEAREDDGAVHLTWQTTAETNNAGFEIERRHDGTDFAKIGFVAGSNTSTEVHTYRFTDVALPFETDRFTYRLRQVDHDGSARIAGRVDIVLGVPERLALHAPFPNPGQGLVTLRYALPTASDVEISVHNVLGQRMATLRDAFQAAGHDVVRVDASRWAAGTYFVRLMAGPHIRTRQFTIVR